MRYWHSQHHPTATTTLPPLASQCLCHLTLAVDSGYWCHQSRVCTELWKETRYLFTKLTHILSHNLIVLKLWNLGSEFSNHSEIQLASQQQSICYRLSSWALLAFEWMPQNTFDDKSTLVQVMAWCHQAPSRYLSRCRPRSMLPYGVTMPQWVNRLPSKFV